jgi:uncharacterized LabA/DUF88 family protein
MAPGGVLLFGAGNMPTEPEVKRAIVFIDGQNLYHGLREAFSSTTHPNYDLLKLSHAVCNAKGWVLKQIRFYTGYPSSKEEPFWNAFWQHKFLSISRQGIWKFTRELRYRDKTLKLDGGTVTFNLGEEKGIDVRIAIDLIRLALNSEYEVAIIFSQDQDLSEATDEIKEISAQQNRWMKVLCAYPVGSGTTNRRGIMKTDWFPFDEDFYTPCIDPTDYRPKKSAK